MLALCLAGLANVAMETMKKKFIVNFAKLLTNGLKFTRKATCLFLQQQPAKNILESFSYALAVSLHQTLAIRAMQRGDSLNNFCKKLLKQSLSKSANLP